MHSPARRYVEYVMLPRPQADLKVRLYASRRRREGPPLHLFWPTEYAVIMPAPPDTERRALVERLREITELLESIAVDRNVLAGVPDEERARLLRAVELVNNPDSRTLRRLAKANKRQKRMARINKADEALHETGIRTLRRKPVFHSPNVFPPKEFTPADLHDEDPDGGPSVRDAVRENVR